MSKQLHFFDAAMPMIEEWQRQRKNIKELLASNHPQNWELAAQLGVHCGISKTDCFYMLHEQQLRKQWKKYIKRKEKNPFALVYFFEFQHISWSVTDDSDKFLLEGAYDGEEYCILFPTCPFMTWEDYSWDTKRYLRNLKKWIQQNKSTLNKWFEGDYQAKLL